VRDHVGLRKLTALASDIATTEAPFDILEEIGIEVDLLIVRTIERTHRRLRKTAVGVCSAGEHDQRRWPVGFPRSFENLLPLDFRAAEHG
jgi:hypothetical protein